MTSIDQTHLDIGFNIMFNFFPTELDFQYYLWVPCIPWCPVVGRVILFCWKLWTFSMSSHYTRAAKNTPVGILSGSVHTVTFPLSNGVPSRAVQSKGL